MITFIMNSFLSNRLLFYTLINYLFMFIFSWNSSTVQRGWNKLLAVCLNFVLPSLECEQSLADEHNAAELNGVLIRASSLGMLLSAQLLLEPREAAQLQGRSQTFIPGGAKRYPRGPIKKFSNILV